MDLDLGRVRKNVEAATTEDLLDRATVYREGMEREALSIIDSELRRRGVSADQIQLHWETKRANVLVRNGLAHRCSFCDRPAVVRGWGWHRLWKKIPLFPQRYRYCDVHRRT